MPGRLLASFRTPENAFRGAPFWAWNGRMEEKEIRRQIRLMKEMGFGGFFMHSRAGLSTPYLSEEWFACISAALDEAGKQGLTPYLYDEDRWPSGFAGGLVTCRDRYKMKYLAVEAADTASNLSGEGHEVALFACRFDEAGNDLLEFRRIFDRAESRGEKILRFFWKTYDDSAKFNNFCYVDTLSREAITEFIRVTHEAYKSRYGKMFGKAIPAIFTDEPCCFFTAVTRLPWTEKLPERFLGKYHYDIEDHLPELFYACGREISAVRWNFYDLVTELFVDAFARQIGGWCGKNGLQLTGHIQGEDYLEVQATYAGSAMRFYEHMGIPGVDVLTEHRNSFAAVKQCVSAARQFGRGRRLSELYACTGWDFPLAGHKALGDWQYAMGINFRCHHLAFYSMAGEAKRDYPASIFYQSPWYRVYRKMEDYFARLGSVLAPGREIRDLLVIHPIESLWSVRLPSEVEALMNSGKLRPPDEDFLFLTQELLAENIDYDFGEEEILSRIGSVEGNALRAGEARYKVVLIPELKTVRTSTLRLLEDFADRGGRVFFLGRAPAFADARRSKEPERVFSKFSPVSREDLAGKLSAARRVSMTDASGRQVRPLLYRLAETEREYTLFVCSFGKEFSPRIFGESAVLERREAFPQVEIRLDLPRRGSVYELDPFTGNVHAVDFEYVAGAYCFTASFQALESHLYLISDDVPADVLPPRRNPPLPRGGKMTIDRFRFELDSPNILVLDSCRCEAEDGTELEGGVLEIDDALRRRLGIPLRGAAMLQPWVEKAARREEKKLPIRLDFTFFCDEPPREPCRLAVEEPETFGFSVNGKELSPAGEAWWIDPAIRLLELPGEYLRRGENHIVATGLYHSGSSGLESVFLLGSFGVREERIVSPPRDLPVGDWCSCGLPFYAGNVTCRAPLPPLPVGEVVIRIPRWNGVCLGVGVNGGEEELILSGEAACSVGSKLRRDGTDTLFIRLYGHRRNQFGPFYLVKKPDWVGPRQFRMYECREKQLVPFGLAEAVEVLWQKNPLSDGPISKVLKNS